MTDMNTQKYQLEIKQQPKIGCVALTKGKDRRPLDPPPIVQVEASRSVDPTQIFLHSPYLILVAKLAPKDQQGQTENKGSDLAGTIVSSLYNLKDTDNTQGGFFIFGDLSVKQEGIFRLEFTLFELRSQQCWQVSKCITDPFQVFSHKSFPGLQKSTFLTRSFSDQGVRLRLRKDSRTVGRRKRRASDDPESPNDQQHHDRRAGVLGYNNTGGYQAGHDPRNAKRMRSMQYSSAGDHPGYDNGYYSHNPNPRTPLVSAAPFPSAAIPMVTTSCYPPAAHNTLSAISPIPCAPRMATIFSPHHPIDNAPISPHSGAAGAGGPNSASSTFHSPQEFKGPPPLSLSTYQYPQAAHHNSSNNNNNNMYVSPTHLSYYQPGPALPPPPITQHGDMMGMTLPGSIDIGDIDK